MRRITLDTNEYVSAFNGGGKALRILHLAIDGEIEIAITEPIIAAPTAAALSPTPALRLSPAC